jgi:hypothetical protein
MLKSVGITDVVIPIILVVPVLVRVLEAHALSFFHRRW